MAQSGGGNDKENEPEATMQEEGSLGVQSMLPPSECVESECLLIDYTDTRTPQGLRHGGLRLYTPPATRRVGY